MDMAYIISVNQHYFLETSVDDSLVEDIDNVILTFNEHLKLNKEKNKREMNKRVSQFLLRKVKKKPRRPLWKPKTKSNKDPITLKYY